MDELTREFRAIVGKLLSACEEEGIFMEPYLGRLDPIEQARLWCQARTIRQVNQEIVNLKSMGADFLAYCIESAGEQGGPLVTSTIPGLSWHQWGEAIDCVWIVDGKEEWSDTNLVNGQNGYHIYTRKAKELGLTSGACFGQKDWNHVQLRREQSPLNLYSLEEINDTMKEQYCHLLDVSSSLLLL